LLSADQLKAIQEAQMLLNSVLVDNEFEPKTFMVTINPNDRQTVDELREQVTLILQKHNLLASLTIASSASAVDITPKNVDKLSGLREVLKFFPKDRCDQSLGSIVALADHVSDINVIKNVGSAYCPAENVHSEVRKLIETRFGSDHVINLSHIDFVLAVIEKECGIRIV
jgi:hydroxymethylpyrimidine pyrophosphatase-like HAD family hydrolase